MAFKYTVQASDYKGLNDIVKRYGFSDYKAAGVTSVPSGNFDLIRPGEVIDIGNYDPSKITGINSGSPVISSVDSQAQFRDNSGKLDTQKGSLIDLSKKDTAGKTGTGTAITSTERTPFATGTKDANGVISTTGDPVLDKLNAYEIEQKGKFNVESERQKAEYSALFNTSLSNIDATANATIANINASYDKRLKEQGRINDINIGRVKAYGLSNGGQYTPISFGDAVTAREQEAADQISALEGQRNSLIAQAEAARQTGKAGLLRQNMDDLAKINTQLNLNLKNVAEESEKQYQLLRDIRKEEETKHQAAVTEMKTKLAALAPQYLDDYNGLDDKSKDTFLTNLANQTGLDYATVFGIMQGATTSAANAALDTKKKETDIKKTEASIFNDNLTSAASAAASRASAAKSYADIEKGKKEGGNDEQKKYDAFTKDAADLIEKLDASDLTKKVDWRTAWDQLHIKYPDASIELLDQTLGLNRRNN